MPMYQVNGRMTVSCFTEVEASSPEEAIRLASEREVMEVITDPGYPIDEFWHIDNDGTPEGLTAEEQ